MVVLVQILYNTT